MKKEESIGPTHVRGTCQKGHGPCTKKQRPVFIPSLMIYH